jgi:hypothetical protein
VRKARLLCGSDAGGLAVRQGWAESGRYDAWWGDWMLCGDWVAGAFGLMGCWVYRGVGGGMVQCEQTCRVSAACGDSGHPLCPELPCCRAPVRAKGGELWC